MVITEAIPNVRTPMWSTNDHGLQDTPCFAFRGWTWNHDFHWFTVFPSSTSNETMNSPTLSEKKQAKTLMNHSLRGSCETSDKPQDGIFLWLFVWLCFGCSKLPNRFFSTEFQMNRCFSMFFLVFSIAWGFEPQETFSFVWELSTWVVGFMEILGPRVLAETELPTSTQNDIERQWPCQKGLHKINQPPSAPGYFQIKRGWMKTIKTLKRQ